MAADSLPRFITCYLFSFVSWRNTMWRNLRSFVRCSAINFRLGTVNGWRHRGHRLWILSNCKLPVSTTFMHLWWCKSSKTMKIDLNGVESPIPRCKHRMRSGAVLQRWKYQLSCVQREPILLWAILITKFSTNGDFSVQLWMRGDENMQIDPLNDERFPYSEVSVPNWNHSGFFINIYVE